MRVKPTTLEPWKAPPIPSTDGTYVYCGADAWETCPKCSGAETTVYHVAYSLGQYLDAKGCQFYVDGEHLQVTCCRCRYTWPRRCHDMAGVP